MMGRLKSDQGQLFYEFHLSEAAAEDLVIDQTPAWWCFTRTARKRLHSIARTCGRLGGFGGWWFWLRRHR